MQNVQNAAEIQQRVINLVELYRTKVGKESQIAKDAKEERDYWDKVIHDDINQLFEDGINEPFGINDMSPDVPEEWVKTLRVNDHLLGHFYSVIAGNGADKGVLAQFLADYYDSSIFTHEEEEFLRSHFKEMVNYIIQTPCDNLENVNHFDGKDWQLLPTEVLELIKSLVQIPADSIVYNPFTGFAQFPLLYPYCKFYCEDSYASYNKRWNLYSSRINNESSIELGHIDENLMTAWMKIALYANSIDSVVIEDGQLPDNYNVVMSFIPRIPDAILDQLYNPNHEIPDDSIVNKIIESYKNLPKEGKMILVLPKNCLWKSNSYYSLRPLWEEMIKDKSFAEVIQLPDVMSYNLHQEICIVIAEKGFESDCTTMIDARFAVLDTKRKNFNLDLDLSSIQAMLINEGKECSTGLRKLLQVPMKELNVDLLLPQVYVLEKPYEVEKPIPLSEVGSLVTTRIRDLQFNLPEETPWVEQKDLSLLFKGNLDLAMLKKADCPNIPPFVKDSEDYTFSITGEFIDGIWAQHSSKGFHVYQYRSCTYLDGKKDAVLFRSTVEGINIAIVRAEDKPIAVDEGIGVLIPKDGVEPLTLVALLRLSVVYRQILAYKDFGLENHLDDILVPSDKRVICDDIFRMKEEETITKEMKEDFEAGQKKHMTKLEDYQHAMRKHIREISSSVRRMERFINGMESSNEIKCFLHERLKVIKTHRLYLSEDIERLNEENTYGRAVPFDIDHCLKGFKDYFGSDAYTIDYKNIVAIEALKLYVKSHRKELNDMNEADKFKTTNRVLEENSSIYVDIAKYNFGKVVRNILENARVHGFSTDTSRNDYKIEIVLTWNSEREMYQIDFCNNGDPLPEGISKDSYGENRKYSGKTGGTGIGGYEVAETVKHYNGDYAISQKGDWVIVSIYLPKSKLYEKEGV